MTSQWRSGVSGRGQRTIYFKTLLYISSCMVSSTNQTVNLTMTSWSEHTLKNLVFVILCVEYRQKIIFTYKSNKHIRFSLKFKLKCQKMAILILVKTFRVHITSNILPSFKIMGLHQPVCQMNKNFNQTAGQVSHKSYLSCVVRATDIAETYNKSH